jgi:hypothetical protein
MTDWLNANMLSINTEKTKFILFRTKNKKPKDTMNISINNNNIKQVKNMDLITKKVVKCAAIISKIRHFTNLNSLKLIYYALVYPYLTYGNLTL